MINFFWIVLISIAVSAITTVLVVWGAYTLFDSIKQFIIKKKLPKDKKDLLDGGPQMIKTDKEVQLTDGRFREYDKLKSIIVGERTATKQSSTSGPSNDQPGNTNIPPRPVGDATKDIGTSGEDKPTTHKW